MLPPPGPRSQTAAWARALHLGSSLHSARPPEPPGRPSKGLARSPEPQFPPVLNKAHNRTFTARGVLRLRAMTVSLGPKEETSQGPWKQEPGLTASPSPRPQSVSLVLLLPLLLPLGPAWPVAAQRCPPTCVCDNPRRHVACRHQNLTEVPDAVPEVSRVRGAGRTATAWLGDCGKSLFLSEPQSSHLSNGITALFNVLCDWNKSVTYEINIELMTNRVREN